MTVELPLTVEDNVRTTVRVDTARPLTVTGEPSTRTVKSVVAAVVLPRFSLYVNVNVVPAVFTAADWNTGGTPAGVTDVEADDADEGASPLVAVVVNV